MASRNLFCVPLIGPEVPEELLKRYWLDVEEQINKLEGSFGKVIKIYHEGNYLAGAEGLERLQKINVNAGQLLTKRGDAGAELLALEDKETFFEIFDCQLFLSLGFSSKEVMDRITKIAPEIMQIFESAIQKRREHIPQQISDTLAEGETGILIMREGERMKIQFPAEINIILVMPPAFSEIERWQKEHLHSEPEV